jgi:hypothetical protein
LVRIIDVIGFSSWPTPNAMDGVPLRQRDTPAAWAAARIRHAAKGNRKQLSLSVAVKAYPRGPIPASQEAMIAEIVARFQGGYCWPELGSLNPTWAEWLMGFPMGWTACEGSGTP